MNSMIAEPSEGLARCGEVLPIGAILPAVLRRYDLGTTHWERPDPENHPAECPNLQSANLESANLELASLPGTDWQIAEE